MAMMAIWHVYACAEMQYGYSFQACRSALEQGSNEIINEDQGSMITNPHRFSRILLSKAWFIVADAPKSSGWTAASDGPAPKVNRCLDSYLLMQRIQRKRAQRS